MAAQILCAPTIIPTFSDIRNLFDPLLQKPDIGLTLPSMPTVPWPPSTTTRNFNFEKVMAASEMVTAQMLGMLKALIQPLVSVIGGTLESLIPKMPVFDISLLDLTPGPPDFSSIIESVKSLVGTFPPSLSNFRNIFPTIPEPLHPQFDAPDMSALQIFQAAVKGYMITLVTTVTNMINQVLGILDISGSFSLPEIPSVETILAIIKAQVGIIIGRQVETFTDLLKGISALASGMKNTLSNVRGYLGGIELPLSVPGFPGITLPLPITPGVDAPDFDLMEIVKNTYSDLVTSQIKRIHDFVTSLGPPFPSFSFPTFCIPVLTFKPALPTITSPSIPSTTLPTIAIT